MHERIRATYHNGTFIPAVPVSLPEAAEVELSFELAAVPVAEAPTALPMIVRSQRGPGLADRPGLTIYPIYEYLLAGHSRELTKQDFNLTDAQLDAVSNYVAEHKEEVEQAYARIVRRSEELQAHYEPIFLARSPYPPDMPWAEKDKLLHQEYARRQQAGLIPPA